MIRRVFPRLATAFVLLLQPAAVLAQGNTAMLNGVVTDESKSVLPGVTVTATDLSTGRPYQSVTDERGEYRMLNMAPGRYKVQSELGGFATAVNPDVEVIVGQNVTLPFTMKLATIEESVTVSGQSPIVDTQSAAVAGYVDRRQMESMPLSGRNWLELSMLVKGVTGNNVSNAPGVETPDQFQVSLDGQQVTQRIGTVGYGGQGKVSRDAVAEFQIITNQFDITQGRSLGMQVQAVTKGGTNRFSGSAYGYFRDDKLNAADFVAKRVLPYENQQVGGTWGGPLRRDRMHFFGSIEYEREPFTAVQQPQLLPQQSWAFDSRNTTAITLLRIDSQVGKKSHITARWTGHRFKNPFDMKTNIGSGHPSLVNDTQIGSANMLATWSRVNTNNLVSELRASFNRVRFYYPAHPEFGCTWNPDAACSAMFSNFVEPGRIPQFSFPGLSIGPGAAISQKFHQNVPEVRYDVTWLRGSHTIKIGGDFLRHGEEGEWHNNDRGTFIFTSLPPDLNRRFPQDAWNNPARWDITGLEPYVLSFQQGFHSDWIVHLPRTLWSVFLGDTWRMSNSLTLNYGIRWDDDLGFASPPLVTDREIPLNNGIEQGNFGYKRFIRDHNNIAVRGGFAYNVGGTGRLVIRGGSGLFYAEPASVFSEHKQLWNTQVSGEWLNDGRPGFMQDPRRGVTKEQMQACKVATSCAIRLPPQNAMTFATDYKMPYTWQNSIGMQKQIGAVTGLDIDLVQWHWYNDLRTRDPNLFYNPATGYNLDPRVAGRPNPNYGQITWREGTGKRDYMAMSSALNRRLHNKLQAGLTHTLMFFYEDDSDTNNNFGIFEWARAQEFQRHTLRTYAIYQLPWRLAVSGVYFYGSGNYFQATHSSTPYGKPGANRLNLGPPVTIPASIAARYEGPSVLCTGCVVPRNALRGLPLHRVDVRLTKDIVLQGMTKISLMGEVFNVFNHANYGSYNLTVNSPTFGEPRPNPGNAYAPRRGQLAVHLTF